MKQEIHFKGLSLTPDNHHAEISALSLCAGAELHDGALRASYLPHTQVSDKLPIPKTNSTFYNYNGYSATLRFVHQGNGYTHFIGTFIIDDTTHTLQFNDVYWYDEAGDDYTHFYGGHLSGIATTPATPAPLAANPTASVIKDIQAIGNTLIFVCTTGVYYFLWKDNGYKYLGQQPPFVKLQFSLIDYEYTGTKEQVLRTAAATMFDLNNQDNLIVDIKEEYRTEFTENAYALINRVNSEITEDGAFYAPFFIRYCYRLYDGTSYILHSPPVLMPVCVGRDNYVRATGLQVTGWGTQNVRIETIGSDNTLAIYPLAAKLQYQLNSSNEWITLKNDWSDIVSSIDIFISQPIVRTKQGGRFECVGKLPFNKTWELRSGSITEYSWNGAWVHAYNPELEEDVYKEKILTPDVFFKIASFTLKDTLATSFTNLPVQGSVLSALAAQPRMEDDYHTHHKLIADSSDNSHSFVYNKRLHIFAASESLFEGFQEDTLLPYFNPPSGGESIGFIYVRLSTEDGDKVVMVGGSSISKISTHFKEDLPIFYPDSRAYSMIIVTNESPSKTYTFPMTKLPLLEGAVTKGVYTDTGSAPSSSDIAYIVPTPNKIYVSEVNNPFFFPLEARQTVGIGSIIGLAVTTLALSPGQFGVFPLIVFCSDGIWTLDVSSTGTYSSAHLISDEVCCNAKSICQLDQSVLFATNRGLSRIIGSSITSVSDALDGPQFPVKRKLFGTIIFDEDVESLLALNTHPYDFFKEGMLLYDFANSRVIVVKTGENAAYVLSLKDGTWSTMSIGNVIAVAKAYPYPYCQQQVFVVETVGGTDVTVEYDPVWHLDQGYNYATSGNDVEPTKYALVVTRSMSFAATMQVIQAFQQIHDCAGGETPDRTPMLYIHGSNDDVNWKLIGYARRTHAPYLPGHPFRFFRLSVYLQMKTWEKYSSLIIDIIEKYQKL